MQRFDGSTFNRVPTGGFSGSDWILDVWAVSGTGGSTSVLPHPSNGIGHFDGQTWTQPVHDGVWWSAVHAVSSTEVWAGGGGGTIKRWDGQSWTTLNVPGLTTADPQNAPFVNSVAARAPNDIYATGGSDAVLRKR